MENISWEPVGNGNLSMNSLTKRLLIVYSMLAIPQLKKDQLLKKSVGIRPGTRDKQPFLGHHPDNAKLLIFNGFGSKGSLMIPWYADRFSRYLIKGDSLPTSADINRYKNDYFSR